MRNLVLVSIFCFGILAGAVEGQVKQATDPDKAGPDFQVQGEYVGETAEKVKLGAEVIARGDGKFQVNFLPGGLRGEGGDYAKRVEASATTEGDKVPIASKDGKWTGTIISGKLTGKSGEGQTFTLSRTVRRSKTEGAKPPEGAIVLFDGTSVDEWKDGKMAAGNLLGSNVASKRTFQDHKIHLEFRLSFMPHATAQARSNSGIYSHSAPPLEGSQGIGRDAQQAE